jgi:hypothetical protein
MTVYWTMRNGEQISVDEMDINHLKNTLKMIILSRPTIDKRKEEFQLNGDMALHSIEMEQDREFAQEHDLYYED